jgi:hypothetical protein
MKKVKHLIARHPQLLVLAITAPIIFHHYLGAMIPCGSSWS